ncbi:cupin domain-containing protein [uncultured Croceitalea sp.]|uniref:cupin domain-containing protein n=1 Tax=uncultured Croceitalea sp. TaxID=1798908 RepID=UPI00374F9836
MYEISNQIKDRKYDKLQVEIVVETPNYDILSISLAKDTTFPNHSSPTDAQLIVLEGDIEFHINGEAYHLQKHQHFSFPKHTEHWVKSNVDSKFLIVR